MKKLTLIVCLTCLFSCRSNTTQIPPKSEPVDYRSRWINLAPFVKKHFDTGDMTLKEIAADLSLAAYKAEVKKRRAGAPVPPPPCD